MIEQPQYRTRQGRIVTTAGVAIQGGRYFLARRSYDGAQGGRWEFPGGKCDMDEDDVRCLKREFREEFDVRVEVFEPVGEVPFSHAGADYVLIGYRIALDSAPRVLRDHIETGWFDPQRLLELDLPESDGILAREMIAAELHRRY